MLLFFACALRLRQDAVLGTPAGERCPRGLEQVTDRMSGATWMIEYAMDLVTRSLDECLPVDNFELQSSKTTSTWPLTRSDVFRIYRNWSDSMHSSPAPITRSLASGLTVDVAFCGSQVDGKSVQFRKFKKIDFDGFYKKLTNGIHDIEFISKSMDNLEASVDVALDHQGTSLEVNDVCTILADGKRLNADEFGVEIDSR